MTTPATWKDKDEQCGNVWNSGTGRRNVCVRPTGHDGPHAIADGTAWWLDEGQPGWTPGPTTRREGRLIICPHCGKEVR